MNINEKPILFSTDMVQAHLAERKTQTRRQTKSLDYINENPDAWDYKGTLKEIKDVDGSITQEKNNCIHIFHRLFNGEIVAGKHIKSPYGQAGDLLWVKENFYFPKQIDGFKPSDVHPNTFHGFTANTEPMAWEIREPKGRTRPSIHMPKIFSRIWLMVESVHLERLQYISEEDAVAEGIDTVNASDDKDEYRNYEVSTVPFDPEFLYSINGDILRSPAKASFRSLWGHINGRDSWFRNPWVWVVKYRVLSLTGKPSDDIIQQNYSELTSSQSGEARRGENHTFNYPY